MTAAMTPSDSEIRCPSCREEMDTRYTDKSGQWAFCRNRDCDDESLAYPIETARARWENELERLGQQRNERNIERGDV